MIVDNDISLPSCSLLAYQSLGTYYLFIKTIGMENQYKPQTSYINYQIIQYELKVTNYIYWKYRNNSDKSFLNISTP